MSQFISSWTGNIVDSVAKLDKLTDTDSILAPIRSVNSLTDSVETENPSTLWIADDGSVYRTEIVEEKIRKSAPIGIGKNSGERNSSRNSAIFQPLSHVEVQSLYVSPNGDIAGAVTIDGLVYMWGRSDRGQCGRISDWIEKPTLVPLRSKTLTCVHGNKEEGADLMVKSLCLGGYSTLASTSDGEIWTWGSLFDQDVVSATPTRIEKLDGRNILQLSAGQDFFVALVEERKYAGSTERQIENIKRRVSLHAHDSMKVDQAERHLSTLKSCRRCQEDKDLRLSSLMAKADAPSPDPDSGGLEDEVCPLGMQLTLELTLSPTKSPLHEMGGPSHTSEGTGSSFTVPLTRKNATQSPNENVELSTMDQRMRSNSTAPGGRFSFVSMDHLLNEVSTSSSEDNVLSDNDSFQSKESDRKPQSPSNRRRIEADKITAPKLVKTEVWTWGMNNAGQLGQGDAVNRREPSPVDRLSQAYIIKCRTGSKHSLAMTATGEIYVWGSNNSGQIKQVENKSVTIPILLKVGSQSSVLDAAAGTDFSVLLVNGLDNCPAVYYCGRDYIPRAEKADLNSSPTGRATAVRLAHIEKLGNVRSLHAVGQRVLASIVSPEDKEDKPASPIASPDSGIQSYSDPSPVSEVDTGNRGLSAVLSLLYGFTFSELKFIRDLKDLYGVVHQLWQKSLVSSAKTKELPWLMQDLCDSLLELFEIVAAGAVGLRKLISVGATEINDLTTSLSVQMSTEFWKSVTKLNNNFCSLVAFGCFSELEITETLEMGLEKLSLEHAIESQKAHRRLKKLLQLPFSRLAQYTEFGENCLKLQEQHPAHQSATVVVLRSKASPLKEIRNVTEKLKIWDKYFQQSYNRAETTNEFWKKQGQGVITAELKVPGRLVIDCFDRYYETGPTRIKNVTALYGTLKLSWTKVIVFSDGLAIVEKRSSHNFVFPLLWIQPGDQEKSKNSLQVLAPEVAYVLEFETGQGKTEFVQTINQALLRWKQMGSGETLSTLSQAHDLPLRRRGKFKFSEKHTIYPSVYYEGIWVNGKPHGSGKLSWENGQIYQGKFKYGQMHGLGVLAAPVSPSHDQTHSAQFDMTKGFWKEGVLSGLAITAYAKSRNKYEGYMLNNLKHGHGVLSSYNKQSMYIGAWSKDMRQGYGVCATRRFKYMGMWHEDKENGLGILISIDGTFYEGTFDRGVFMKGTMLCPDGTRFEGDFNGLGVLNGKGILSFTNKDSMSGWFYGSLADGTVKITSGTYTRTTLTSQPSSPVTSCLNTMGSERLNLNHESTVPPDQKWTEIFDQFISQELGLSGTEIRNPHPCTNTAWTSLAVSLERLRNFQQHRPDISDIPTIASSLDSLEVIPQWDNPWSFHYLIMVNDYCSQALEVSFHPLSRLVSGLADVFCNVYSDIAAHPSLLTPAVMELKSIIKRIYRVIRLLFPSLPQDEYLDCLVHPEDSHEEESTNHFSSPGAETMTPVSFITDRVLRITYPTIFFLFAYQCDKPDRNYWNRITVLNMKNDVSLLDFLEVKSQLWPIELKNTEVLDAPMICATAKKKYYASAIDCLQQLGSKFSPKEKLKVLSETFTEITECVAQYSASPAHVWSMDDLFPVLLYVVVRAQIQRLGAEIQLMEEFLPQMQEMGQVSLMFTTFKSSYYQILKERHSN